MSETNESSRELDVAVIGAGFSGIYVVYSFKKRGLNVKAFEKGAGVGGTWFWNRYPGCGSDIESLEYSYSFSEELQQDWKWKERYGSQPEIEAYLEHVTDRFGLRDDIELAKEVVDLLWEGHSNRWRVSFADGEIVSAKFCVMATGLLSSPKKVEFPGLSTFHGELLETYNWPHEHVSFEGKRVGIIGTGSTAVQAIPIIAETASELVVFQRTPNFSAPRNNGPLDPEYESRVKSMYPQWREKQRNSFGGYVSVNFQPEEPNPNAGSDMTDDQILEEFELRWKSGGLSFYTSFYDLLLNKEVNDKLGEFFREKIRAKIKDPDKARLLVPNGYPVLTKRLCADTNYYETFNAQHVHIVDLAETPIQRFSELGITTTQTNYELDQIILATGFDAVTGALVNMNIKGAEGRTLRETWADGPRTNAGLMTNGFPNMFFVNGPGSCTGFFNPVLNVEYQGEWFGELIRYMDENGHERVDSSCEGDAYWVDHMAEVARPTLFWNSENWYIGANVPGKSRVMLLYLGGFPAYKEYTGDQSANEYPSFNFS
ncbi:MAG: cyclohexanone monooxygenase [Porticoccaceae bacterium]|nr:cyclohexanone monooxygenase [Porticoccaceae bacterium]